MGKGKTKNDSVSAYDECINPNIQNKVFMSKRTICPEDPKDRKVASFYSRYYMNSSKRIKITRNPFAFDNVSAHEKFLRLVKNYQENTKLHLFDISKNELLNQFLDLVEETNSIVYLEDDAKQFLPYRMLFPDVLKLYLYKMLYPRIFDFIISSDGKRITFNSHYIETNIETICRQIETIGMAIIYDSMLIATENAIVGFVRSMKGCKIDIDPSESVEDMYLHMDNGFKTSKDPRTPLLRILKPSICFLSKHFGMVYGSRNITGKYITSILKSDTFYSGKRSDESRIALENAFRECHPLLTDNKLPFTRLLNLYYLNKRSYLFDLDIMNNNNDFMPYALDGIVTKHLLNSIIIENNDLMGTDSSALSGNCKKFEAECTDKQSAVNLELTSVYNNPNCILTNISTRDYEILNYLMTGLSRAFKDYYLKNKSEDVPPSKLAEIIQLLNTNKLTPAISDIIAPFGTLCVNNVNYETVMRHRATDYGGEVTGLFQISEKLSH